jgi:hypothetical protein
MTRLVSRTVRLRDEDRAGPVADGQSGQVTVEQLVQAQAVEHVADHRCRSDVEGFVRRGVPAVGHEKLPGTRVSGRWLIDARDREGEKNLPAGLYDAPSPAGNFIIRRGSGRPLQRTAGEWAPDPPTELDKRDVCT